MVYVGAGGTKLYKFDGSNYRTRFKTAVIDLNAPFKISGIKVIGKSLESLGNMDIKIQEEAENDIVSGNYSFSKDGGISKKFISHKQGANPIQDQIIITATSSGDVRIKRIDVFGEPIEEYG